MAAAAPPPGPARADLGRPRPGRVAGAGGRRGAFAEGGIRTSGSCLWVSGANAWTDERRQAFANDLTRPELIAVSESVNLDKAGSSPATWRPPRRSYWCTYARAWITVKHHYGLTITYREKRALIRMLRTCFSAQPSA
ncbi:GmrSD restriction endonuclease domain-containing protein [Actinomadura sp. ATCC 39365]